MREVKRPNKFSGGSLRVEKWAQKAQKNPEKKGGKKEKKKDKNLMRGQGQSKYRREAQRP